MWKQILGDGGPGETVAVFGQDAFIGFDVFDFADELGVQADFHDLQHFTL